MTSCTEKMETRTTSLPTSTLECQLKLSPDNKYPQFYTIDSETLLDLTPALLSTLHTCTVHCAPTLPPAHPSQPHQPDRQAQPDSDHDIIFDVSLAHLVSAFTLTIDPTPQLQITFSSFILRGKRNAIITEPEQVFKRIQPLCNISALHSIKVALRWKEFRWVRDPADGGKWVQEREQEKCRPGVGSRFDDMWWILVSPPHWVRSFFFQECRFETHLHESNPFFRSTPTISWLGSSRSFTPRSKTHCREECVIFKHNPAHFPATYSILNILKSFNF